MGRVSNAIRRQRPLEIGKGTNHRRAPRLLLVVRPHLVPQLRWLRMGLLFDVAVSQRPGGCWLVLTQGLAYDLRKGNGRSSAHTIHPLMLSIPLADLVGIPAGVEPPEAVQWHADMGTLEMRLPLWAQGAAEVAPAPRPPTLAEWLCSKEPKKAPPPPARPQGSSLEAAQAAPAYQGICDRVPDPAADLRTRARLLPAFAREL